MGYSNSFTFFNNIRSNIKTILGNILGVLERIPFWPIHYLSESAARDTKRSYSSFGEDALIDGILKRYEFLYKQKLEFSYIDVGAWHPLRGSNTYRFYRQGIHGTVVEPNPYLRNSWKALRPSDRFLNIGCSQNNFEELHILEKKAASNTFVPKFANFISLSQNVDVAEKIKVECWTLQEIVQYHKNFFPNEFILDIDVEGMDIDVLESLNFQNVFRPVLVLVEDLVFSEHLQSSSAIHRFMKINNYSLIGRATITSIYADNTHPISKLESAFNPL